MWKNQSFDSSRNKDKKSSLMIPLAFMSLFVALVCVSALPSSAASPVFSSTSLDVPPGFIDQVLAGFVLDDASNLVRTHNVTKKLAKRARPADQGCDNEDDWVARLCRPDEGPRIFDDECTDDDGNNYQVQGMCPELTFCAEEIDGDGDNTIVCAPSTPPKEDNVSRNGKKVQQYGYRVVQGAPALNTQHEEKVSIKTSIGSGSVAAQLRSSDRSFVIAPHNTLTANLHGYNLNLCRSSTGDAKHGRDCNPTNQRNLRIGDEIDITFGLSAWQSAILFYSISGA